MSSGEVFSQSLNIFLQSNVLHPASCVLHFVLAAKQKVYSEAKLAMVHCIAGIPEVKSYDLLTFKTYKGDQIEKNTFMLLLDSQIYRTL